MPQLSDVLQSINASYGAVSGVTLPTVTETMTVSQYIAVIDTLQAQAISLLDSAIAAAIDAGRFIDVSVQLSLLRNLRAALVDQHDDIHQALNGINPALSLQGAWTVLTGGAGGDDGAGDDGGSDGGTGGDDGGGTGGGTTPEPPYVYPDDGAVVLYGTTPQLLRKPDVGVPAGAKFSPPDLGSVGYVVSSPEISLQTNGSWSVGTVTGSGSDAAWQVIKNAGIDGAKNLVGELISASGNTYAGLGYQAWEAYELGEMMSQTAGTSIGFIASGLQVLQGTKSFAEWNDEHNAFLNSTKNQYDAKAASALVSKVPVVGWVLSPVVDSFFKVSYKLQNTNSFEISLSAETALAGGDKGGVLLGSRGSDQIRAGNGGVLVSGGEGNDTITAGSGRQYFLGDGGMDVLVYEGASSGFSVSRAGSMHRISGVAGVHDFTGIERVSFTDRKLAFDLAKGEAAEQAVRLISAALDTGALTPQLIGIGIRQFDQGQTMVQVAELAMATPEFRALLADQTDQSFVSRIYQNVVGAVPGQPTIDLFVGMLAGHGGTMSRAELLVMAANTPQNAVNIDLVGLADSGIAWL